MNHKFQSSKFKTRVLVIEILVFGAYLEFEVWDLVLI